MQLSMKITGFIDKDGCFLGYQSKLSQNPVNAYYRRIPQI